MPSKKPVSKSQVKRIAIQKTSRGSTTRRGKATTKAGSQSKTGAKKRTIISAPEWSRLNPQGVTPAVLSLRDHINSHRQ